MKACSYSTVGTSKKVEAEIAKTRTPNRIMFGSGGEISAIIGEKMVANLARKLQKPAAVAQKRVGNNFSNDK